MSTHTSELERFLAARLEGSSEWVGNSSNAMVREALGGERVRQYFEYPHDHADLARCCMTYARAPWSMKAIMLPRLTVFCEHGMNGFMPPAPPPKPVKKSRFLDRIREMIHEALS